MKKNDIILIVGIAIIAIVAISYIFLNRKEGAKVIISVGGKVEQEYNLDENQIIQIKTGDDDYDNILEIKDGYATMIEANCPDQICVHQKSISKEGESIVCLPHQVIVTIKGNESSSLDSVAN